jgi:hypothetical protein
MEQPRSVDTQMPRSLVTLLLIHVFLRNEGHVTDLSDTTYTLTLKDTFLNPSGGKCHSISTMISFVALAGSNANSP